MAPEAGYVVGADIGGSNLRLALADRHSRTRDHHCVHYRVVDLILNRPIGSPAAGHF